MPIKILRLPMGQVSVMQNAYGAILRFRSDIMPIGDYVEACRVILKSNLLQTSRLPKMELLIQKEPQLASTHSFGPQVPEVQLQEQRGLKIQLQKPNGLKVHTQEPCLLRCRRLHT
ncbi:hypothetical protein HAX54_026056 [Datura stramonium]|uniref:Uncharacterized protein n=1 Tax=Datura stramonium TaxID=4076 RepID=A0ABS8V0J6_DATST|nr:hypothetical protein [Datura stramonium]